MNLKLMINNLANRIGYDIKKYPILEQRRLKNILTHNNINKVIDIGANVGQYGEMLRSMGYNGFIKSFEPVLDSYKILNLTTKEDFAWDSYNMAIGDVDSRSSINISGQSPSSSFLSMKTVMTNNYDDLKYIRQEEIDIRRLDTIFNGEIGFKTDENIFVKIDTQGYEEKVLKGATKSLEHIKGIQIEMSLIELYEGESLINTMINFLYSNGFKLHGLENGFYNAKTLQQYQVDGIFIKSE